MAKDVITRFKLETTAFDSKLKQAAKGLSDYSKTATQAKEGFNQFTKANVEAARSLGSMQASSVKTKDKVKELVAAYNEAAKAYNQLSKEQQNSDWAKALAGSLTQLQQRIRDTKQEMQSLNTTTKSTSMFSGLGDKLGGAMQVFAGNLMTKATMEVANLGAEMVGMVQQGVELAKAGEGIRNAFARLGRGDILDGLRQATHGTVTDLELMKAAVKFNDFRLPLNELGTMLAFAQQKAKDTGQSVDYMVDSIVTGLGRKSLMILDNLGLSASEIRERMKETGDMTTAVGAIIREQMQKAGDYMETAADRAAQANVNLQNKLEEVGRKFAPIEEASTQLWTSMKIGILDVVSGPLARLLNGLTEAGRLRNQMNDMAGGNSDSETEKQIKFLRNTSAGNRRARYDKQIAIYNTQEANEWRSVNALKAQREAFRKEVMRRGARESDQDTYNDFDRQIATHTNRARSWQMFRINYQQRAQGLLNPNKPLPPSSDTTNTVIPTKTGKGGKATVVEEVFPEGSMKDLQRDMQELKKAQDLVTSPDEWQKYQQQIDAVTEKMNTLRGVAQKAPEMAEGVSGLNQKAIATYQSMLQESMKGMEYGSTDLTQTLANSIDVTTLSNLLKTTLDQGLDITKMKFENGSPVIESLGETILSDKNIDDKVWEDLSTIFSEQLKAKGGKGIKLNTATGAVSEEQQQAQVDYLQQMQKLNSGLSSINSGLQQIGIKLPDGMQKMLTVMQGVTSVIQGVQTVISVFSTSTQSANTAAVMANTGTITALTAAVVANTAALSVNTTANFIPFATGGIVHAAGGTVVPGNSFSGDNIPALLNSGEVVLTRAQAGVIADALGEGNGNQGTTPSRPYVSGEQIYLGLNNYLRRSGRGEIITSR